MKQLYQHKPIFYTLLTLIGVNIIAGMIASLASTTTVRA